MSIKKFAKESYKKYRKSVEEEREFRRKLKEVRKETQRRSVLKQREQLLKEAKKVKPQKKFIPPKIDIKQLGFKQQVKRKSSIGRTSNKTPSNWNVLTGYR